MHNKYQFIKHSGLILVLLLIMAGLFFQCETYYPTVGSRNVASIYNPSSTPLHPEYAFFVSNDSSSTLLARVFVDELLFNQANAAMEMRGQLKIHYRLYHSFETSQIIDSASIIYTLNKEQLQEEMLTYLPIGGASQLEEFVVEIRATDLLRKKQAISYIKVNNANPNSSARFFVSYSDDMSPVFRKFLALNQGVSIRYTGNTEQLFVDYYENKFPLPAPPFSSIPNDSTVRQADSSWTIPYNRNAFFEINKEGVYRFRVDTTFQDGLVLSCFDEHFPRMRESSQLIRPLQYLTSSQEYEEILDLPNNKIALDNFWLKTTGNMNRAKELIRIYYNRVLFANLYFTTFKEGWRTDRGMIYTVFGPPGKIFLTEEGERWVYAQTQNTAATSFDFIATKHPLDANYYVLDRSSSHKTVWYQAVETWRNGRAFFMEY